MSAWFVLAMATKGVCWSDGIGLATVRSGLQWEDVLYGTARAPGTNLKRMLAEIEADIVRGVDYGHGPDQTATVAMVNGRAVGVAFSEGADVVIFDELGEYTEETHRAVESRLRSLGSSRITVIRGR